VTQPEIGRRVIRVYSVKAGRFGVLPCEAGALKEMHSRRFSQYGGVAGIGVVCVIGTIHHSSLCGQFDRGGMYCATVATEQPHGSHDERPAFPYGSYTSVAVGSASSTATIGGSFTVRRV
jgi:hypothetical protein